MENKTKNLITELLINNCITGRIITDPRNYNKGFQTDMSFDDVIVKDNIAMLYDTNSDTRAELSGVFKLPFDLIKEAHFTEDFLTYGNLYGKYHVLIYLGKDLDKEILLTFDMKDRNESPFISDNDEALSYAYAKEAIPKLDYFKDKSVKINISSSSYQSRYDVDNNNYSDPLTMSMDIKSFDYFLNIIDGIPCITITDKNNECIKLVLNAVSGVIRCNEFDTKPEDKRIYNVCCEIGSVSIMDKEYIFPVQEVEKGRI